MHRAFGIGTALVLPLVVVGACSDDNPLIGTWSDKPGSGIEFLSGGTCLLQSPTAMGASCAWEVASDGRVIMRESVMGSTFTFVGQINGDALVFQGPDGKPLAPLHRE